MTKNPFNIDIEDARTDGGDPRAGHWPYPWDRDEDPDHVDPAFEPAPDSIYNETEGDFARSNAPLSENVDYTTWWNTMRAKYDYPREEHVKRWFPRFREWVKTKGV